MKRLIIALAGTVLLGFGMAGCDLLDPTNTENPDVLESDYLSFPNPIRNWLAGMERQMAIAADNLFISGEITSDNYINTETFFSQSMDALEMDYREDDIEDPFLEISEVREMAEFGINVVAEADEDATDDDVAELWFFKGASHLYVGEYWHTAPADSAGPAASSAEQFQEAVTALENALDLTSSSANAAGYHIMLARAYRNLGDRENARQHAETALSVDLDYVRFAQYDNVNDPDNDVQLALFDRGTFDDLQPLIRLDFLDPKYFIGANPSPGDDEQSDIAYVKAEEAYLIIAEAQLAENDFAEARETMHDLLDVVNGRKRTQLVDVAEDRIQAAPGSRPHTAGWEIAFSPQDTFHTGLVIPRRSPVQIPVISGTAVTDAVVDRLTTLEDLLEMVYRLRQEIFIAEGRRMHDLGVKWPLPEVEIINNPNIELGPATEPYVPAFLPPGEEFDAVDSIDFGAKRATLLHNLNRILVENRSSDDVVPFF